jgi:hypothetical protein
MTNKQQVHLDIDQAEDYKCEQCQHDRFKISYFVKRFSPLVSPTGEEMLIPVQAFSCEKCDHVNTDFLPNNNPLRPVE